MVMFPPEFMLTPEALLLTLFSGKLNLFLAGEEVLVVEAVLTSTILFIQGPF